MVVVDFMAYAWKVGTKKMNLITYEDFFKGLWKTFSSLSIGCNRMDIVFDSYFEQSIKHAEWSRRSKLEPIDINLYLSLTLISRASVFPPTIYKKLLVNFAITSLILFTIDFSIKFSQVSDLLIPCNKVIHL